MKAVAHLAPNVFIRTALIVGALLCAPPFVRPAAADNSPLFFGAKVPASGIGPVLSNPEIVPVFYGDFSTNSVDFVTEDYLWGFSNYLAGGETPNAGTTNAADLSMDPVLRQYGVWGATIDNPFYFPGANVPNTESGTVAALHSWQSQGLLPPDGQNRIFLVVMNGFSNYTWQVPQSGGGFDPCAFHKVSGNTYYVLVSWDGCTGQDNSEFERIMSHELEETATDPDMYNLSYGWVTHAGVLGLSSGEGADQCETNEGDPPLPFAGSLSFGTLQNFTDNEAIERGGPIPGDGSASEAHCETWAYPRAAHFSVLARNNTQLDVIYQNVNDGSLDHAWFDVGYTWHNEVIDPWPGALVGAPAVSGKWVDGLDVVVRVLNGSSGGGLMYYQLNSISGEWTSAVPLSGANGPGIGQPTMVSWGSSPGNGSGRLDVFTSDIDATVLHFWSDNGGAFNSQNLGGFLLGPQTVTSGGTYMVYLFFFGSYAGLNVWSWNAPGAPNKWSGGDLNTPTGIYFSYPADVISAVPFHQNSNTATADAMAVYVPANVWDYNTSNWSKSSWYDLGTEDSRGTVAVAADNLTNSSVMVVRWFQYIGDASDTNGGFYAAARFQEGAMSPNQEFQLNGDYISAPQVVYGNDGFPEVLGVGTDGCLYENWLDFLGDGFPVVNGPFATGICGMR